MKKNQTVLIFILAFALLLVSAYLLYEKLSQDVLPEQQLSAPERNGFTVVEWGGTEINK